ncbi:hypothetical protein MKZ38_006998 [Zalerion maritima]|uniref:Uncharacterized protein n=1 Tax=Zalerion maritima TaxID=339359 RepID=A0AAD5RJG8_9PEZI|nr:hypothetical protein MKZ38_006998 [Zalerion maritima]
MRSSQLITTLLCLTLSVFALPVRHYDEDAVDGLEVRHMANSTTVHTMGVVSATATASGSSPDFSVAGAAEAADNSLAQENSPTPIKISDPPTDTDQNDAETEEQEPYTPTENDSDGNGLEEPSAPKGWVVGVVIGCVVFAIIVIIFVSKGCGSNGNWAIGCSSCGGT